MTRVLPIDGLAWSDDPLERVAELSQVRGIIDWMTERAVVGCRQNSVSWTQIARQLGITRQVAWRKYAHLQEGDAR